jgi:hypothetical protein
MPKLLPDEVKKLKSLQADSLEIKATLGELNYSKVMLDFLIEEQVKLMKELKIREQSLYEEFNAKYGDIIINLETEEYS